MRQLLREVANYREASSIADIGCSNGYITNLLSDVCRGKVHGFDYLPELVGEARSLYPHIEFRRADLNRTVRWKQQFELVCCFETLEHAGDLESALDNVLRAVRPGGVLIVSIPVETGVWGLAKYVAKTLMGYPMNEINAGRAEYLRALVTRKDISAYRQERYTWGTHYGFDWRKVEEALAARMTITKAYTRVATRIIIARKPLSPSAST